MFARSSRNLLSLSSRTSFNPLLKRYGSDISKPPRVLVTGCLGQIGTELVRELRTMYGIENVIATDIRKKPEGYPEGPFCFGDVTDRGVIQSLVINHSIDWVVHLSGILSAAGEQDPSLAMSVNVDGVENVLQVAKKNNLRIFIPSSIAAFGPSTPPDQTPDLVVMRPNTIYGVTKIYAELLGEYYHRKFGVDFRSLRYPGVVSADTDPGGGTTDYAVGIFKEGLKTKNYSCFLRKDSALPMMYMPDCLNATLRLLTTERSNLSQCTYNVTALSFTPEELTAAIHKYVPELKVSYDPDFRQAIADTWPNSLDDSSARRDWGWSPKYDLDGMVKDMIEKCS